MIDLRGTGLSELRQEMTNTHNRLHSINRDSTFVGQVAQSGSLPVVPNLRCGAWYVDPSLVPLGGTSFAYFKSTDGHTSQWDFNLRRANLHLLPLIIAHGGIILVDSTRRGKRHPDALSRTVPIWCAVINRTLGLKGEHSRLYTPPDSVSPSEHAQMEDKVNGWAKLLEDSTYNLPNLTKPLRPFWISPDSSNLRVPIVNEWSAFYAIVCVSASQRVQDGVDRRLGYTYVQGSGDDHEMWSQGLTPNLFWRYKLELLACPREDLDRLIRDILDMERDTSDIATLHEIRAARGRLLVGSWAAGHTINEMVREPCAMLILNDTKSSSIDHPESKLLDGAASVSDPLGPPPPILHVAGYYPRQHPTEFLTRTLPASLKFIQSHLSVSPSSRVAILCKDAKDLSVGVATTFLALYFNDAGEFSTNTPDIVTKDLVRRRLQWVISSCPNANPARATLKRINEYLMSPNRPSLQNNPR